VTPTSKVNRKINRKQLRNRSRTRAIPGGTHEHINMNTLTDNLTTPPQTVETAILPHNAVGIDHSRAENAIREFQVKLLRSGRPTNPQSPPPARGRKSKGALPSFPDNVQPLKAQLLRVPVASLGASAAQPRRAFDPDALQELATSVKARGVLQPILVRPAPVAAGADETGMPTYEIVAGERRWRASQQAGLEDVPVLVQSFSDAVAAEIGLVENLQREDLTPLETAGALARMTEQGYSIRKLANCLGKQKGWVEQHLLLVRLPEDLRVMVSGRPDTLTHARELQKLKNEALRAELIASVLDADRPLSLAGLRRRIRQASGQAWGGETLSQEPGDPQGENRQDAPGTSRETASAEDPCADGDVPSAAVGVYAGDEETGDREGADDNESARGMTVEGMTVEEGVDAEGLLRQEAILANVRALRRRLPAMRVPAPGQARESLVGELSALRDAIVSLLGDWGVTG